MGLFGKKYNNTEVKSDFLKDNMSQLDKIRVDIDGVLRQVQMIQGEFAALDSGYNSSYMSSIYAMSANELEAEISRLNKIRLSVDACISDCERAKKLRNDAGDFSDRQIKAREARDKKKKKDEELTNEISAIVDETINTQFIHYSSDNDSDSEPISKAPGLVYDPK